MINRYKDGGYAQWGGLVYANARSRRGGNSRRAISNHSLSKLGWLLDNFWLLLVCLGKR